MEYQVIKFEILPHGVAATPTYATEGSSGMDLYAAVEEHLTIQSREWMLIPTGIRLALDAGWEAQIRPRSGLALKHGITVLNTPGTIDSDYRGEVKIILMNHGAAAFKISRGDKIAQMVFARVHKAALIAFAALPDRGDGGFGSTDEKEIEK